jgi:hypothetical protein
MYHWMTDTWDERVSKASEEKIGGTRKLQSQVNT